MRNTIEILGLTALVLGFASTNAVGQSDNEQQQEQKAQQQAQKAQQQAQQQAQKQAQKQQQQEQKQQAQDLEARQRDQASLQRDLEQAREELQQAAREVARLSSELAAPIVRDVQHQFRYRGQRSMLGFVTEDVERGVRVASVTPNGPAAEAGLKVGETVTEIDGARLTDTRPAGGGRQSPTELLLAQMANVDPGESVKLHVINEAGAERDVTVKARPMATNVWINPPTPPGAPGSVSLLRPGQLLVLRTDESVVADAAGCGDRGSRQLLRHDEGPARAARARRHDAAAQGRRRDPRHRRPRADVARARDAHPRQLPEGRAAEDHDHAEQEQANARREAAGVAIAQGARRARARPARRGVSPDPAATRPPTRARAGSRRISPRMLRSDFHYDLPRELIAQTPLAERSGEPAARARRRDGRVRRPAFRGSAALLRAGDLLVFNDTRVLPARLTGKRGRAAGASRCCSSACWPLDACSCSCARATCRSPAPSSSSRAARALASTRRDDGFVELTLDRDAAALWREHGEMPLPPYIERAPDASDRERYQTVFAREPGAVAAPTAGLHFDAALLAALEARGVERAFVTLHVGAGTFQPVRVERVEDHVLHANGSAFPPSSARLSHAAARAAGASSRSARRSCARSRRRLASGELAPFAGESALFIFPGFRFRAVDALVTNFHLPESTLLMLVAAFAGRERSLAAYRHAVASATAFSAMAMRCS